MPTSLAVMGLALILVTSILLWYSLQDRTDFAQKSVWLICLLLLGIFAFLLSIFSLNQVLWFFIVAGLISFLWSKVLKKDDTQLLLNEISKVLQKLFPWFLFLVVLRLFLEVFIIFHPIQWNLL
ncbi:MAG: hypothetical protein N4Q30_05885 [Neisseriaceae bacterium]|nr:hypothetical protein [Neisseriaceae bacterium]